MWLILAHSGTCGSFGSLLTAAQGGYGVGNESAKYYKTITTPKHFAGQIFEGGDMGNGTTMDRTRNDSRISVQVSSVAT